MWSETATSKYEHIWNSLNYINLPIGRSKYGEQHGLFGDRQTDTIAHQGNLNKTL